MSQETEKRSLRAVEERRRRLRNTAILGPGLVGLPSVFVLIFLPEFYYEIGLQIRTVLLMAAALIVGSTTVLLWNYLQRGYLIERAFQAAGAIGSALKSTELEHQLRSMTEEQSHEIKNLGSELTALRDKLSRSLAPADVLTHERQEELANAVRDKIESEAVQELLDKIQLQVSAFRNTDSQLTDLSRQSSSTVARLENEVSALTRRGNLNLVLGIMTTVSGLAVLTEVGLT